MVYALAHHMKKMKVRVIHARIDVMVYVLNSFVHNDRSDNVHGLGSKLRVMQRRYGGRIG